MSVAGKSFLNNCYLYEKGIIILFRNHALTDSCRLDLTTSSGYIRKPDRVSAHQIGYENTYLLTKPVDRNGLVMVLISTAPSLRNVQKFLKLQGVKITHVLSTTG